MPATTFAVCNFDHPHVPFNVGYVREHPEAELVALCDERSETSIESLAEIADGHDVPADRRYDDLDRCLREADPDVAFLCPNTAAHAEWTERAAAHDVHVLVEKPFAETLADADRMIAAQEGTGNRLGINWPLTWAPSVRTVRRLLDEGTIGEVREIHYYGGNSGPDRDSWFYDPDLGGGSLLDYLGYGVTLATWFRGGKLPTHVTAEAFVPDGGGVDAASSDGRSAVTEAGAVGGRDAVDEQSVVAATYESGPSVFETTWRSFTNPWEHPTEPANGFVVVGTDGTISTRHDDGIGVQTTEQPDGYTIEADPTEPPHENVVQYVVDRLQRDAPFDGPTSVQLSRKGQLITEAARRSAAEGRRVSLADLK